MMPQPAPPSCEQVATAPRTATTPAPMSAPLPSEWPRTATANGVVRETLLAGLGLDRDLIAREAREASGDLDSRLILNLKLIVEVDAKREVLKGTKRLSPALRCNSRSDFPPKRSAGDRACF